MRSTIVQTASMFSICMLSASANSAAAAMATTSAPMPEIVIPALWAELDEHWNEGDARRFSEVFTADASLHFVDAGLALESSETILQHFSKQFPTFPPDIRHETSVTGMRPLAAGVRAVDATVRILRDTAGAGGDVLVLRTYSVFAVMLETPEGWRIHLLRAYLLPAEPKPDATTNAVTRLSTRAGP